MLRKQPMDRDEVKGVTIDEPHTNHIEDAIWLDEDNVGYIAQISFPDVSHIVRNPGKIYPKAIEKGFPNHEPLLPEKISQDDASFLPGYKTPSITFSIPLDGDAKPEKLLFRKTMLRNESALTYQGIEDRIEIDSDLKASYEISRRLFENRKGEHREGMYKSRFMVKEFMILVNNLMAGFFRKEGIPCLYRNNAGSSFYSPDNEGHSRMGLRAYTHITSPLRRASDLVNQWQVSEILSGGDSFYTKNEMKEIAEHMNHLESRYRKYKK